MRHQPVFLAVAVSIVLVACGGGFTQPSLEDFPVVADSIIVDEGGDCVQTGCGVWRSFEPTGESEPCDLVATIANLAVATGASEVDPPEIVSTCSDGSETRWSLPVGGKCEWGITLEESGLVTFGFGIDGDWHPPFSGRAECPEVPAT